MDKDAFAMVIWTVADIKNLRPHWTDEQCIEWLSQNEKRLAEVMIERGWNFIEPNLPD